MGIGLALATPMFSQIFTDDFESYSPGALLVASNPTDWDTWTSPYTASEDVAIDTMNAASGTKSLYFQSVGAGGPEDIIHRFASVYNSGDFALEMNVFVESNKGAYFNLQETHIEKKCNIEKITIKRILLSGLKKKINL